MSDDAWWLVPAVFAVYMALCWIHPQSWCRFCDGTGRNSKGKNFGRCWWCKGTKHRRRWGARVMGRGE